MLFSWMLFSSYATISFYFFIKKFTFSNFYIELSMYLNVFRMYLHIFWLRKGSWINWARNWWGDWGGAGGVMIMYSKYIKLHIGVYRGGVSRLMCTYVRTHLHYLFSCFWHHFCLIVSCFICRNLLLSLLKKGVFASNGCFSPRNQVFLLKIIFAKQG